MNRIEISTIVDMTWYEARELEPERVIQTAKVGVRFSVPPKVTTLLVEPDEVKYSRSSIELTMDKVVRKLQELVSEKPRSIYNPDGKITTVITTWDPEPETKTAADAPQVTPKRCKREAHQGD